MIEFGPSTTFTTLQINYGTKFISQGSVQEYFGQRYIFKSMAAGAALLRFDSSARRLHLSLYDRTLAPYRKGGFAQRN